MTFVKDNNVSNLVHTSMDSLMVNSFFIQLHTLHPYCENLLFLKAAIPVLYPIRVRRNGVLKNTFKLIFFKFNTTQIHHTAFYK